MPSFILVTGIDGSGKTTLSKTLVGRLNQGSYQYVYRHANEVPILMRLVKMSIKATFLRKHDAFARYNDYVRRKEEMSSRHGTLSRLYRIFLILDYVPQVIVKICIPLWFGRRLVVDRYIHDVIINLGLNIRYTSARYRGDVSRFYRFFPRPDFTVFLDTDEAVAFSRKSDVPSIDYLKERRSVYVDLADAEDMHRIQGEGSPDELADRVIALISQNGGS